MLVASIVLAAGQSRRMGKLKQLLPLAGRTVIETVVDRVLEATTIDQNLLWVVVGHCSEQVEKCLHQKNICCVKNYRYREGMVTSVQCGIEAINQKVDGYIIFLGDQPDVKPEVIDIVISHAHETKAGIVIPSYRGKRGHPLFISSKYRSEILNLTADQGLNIVTRSHQEDTEEIAVESIEILEDMDTPEDYTRISARFTINF